MRRHVDDRVLDEVHESGRSEEEHERWGQQRELLPEEEVPQIRWQEPLSTVRSTSMERRPVGTVVTS